eukprot:1149604-Pelagomonas_calceolata.AAC.3
MPLFLPLPVIAIMAVLISLGMIWIVAKQIMMEHHDHIAKASCNLNEDCQAWTYDGYRAFLKTAKGPMTYREGCFELIFHAKLID